MLLQMNQDQLSSEYIQYWQQSKSKKYVLENPKINEIIQQHNKTKITTNSSGSIDPILNPNQRKGTRTPKAIVRVQNSS